MAREEQQREDLLRDAKAYAWRAQWQTPLCQEPVFVGFRNNSGPSFFFGQDDVYHFNTKGELRRAYIQGELIKAEQRQLVVLKRHRTKDEVQLLRRENSPNQTAELMRHFRNQLDCLVSAFQDGTAKLDGAVSPADDPTADIQQMVINWAAQHPHPAIAESPNSQ